MTRLRCCLACALALALAAGDAAPPELAEQPYDIVVLADGRSLEGLLIERREDGSLLFQRQGRDKPERIGAGMYTELRPRRDAARAVREVGRAAAAAGDRRRLLAALRWGLERRAAEAVAEVAGAWLERQPADREVLALAAGLWSRQGAWDELERRARAALAADPQFLDAHGWLCEALEGQGRAAEAEAQARAWLERQPTARRANQLLARAAERAGDLRQAYILQRKVWEVHRDPESGRAALHLAFALGRLTEVGELAAALVQADASAEPLARVYRAAAALAQGDAEAARALLAAPRGTLPEPAAAVAAYAEGLLAYREGRREAASARWQGLALPAAPLALAIARRQPPPEALPEAWRPLARQLAAALALARGDARAALSAVEALHDGAARRLQRIARAAIEPAAEPALGDDREAWRWLAFLLALADDARAEAALARLGADDPYAAIYRAYRAARRGQAAAARALLAEAPPLPPELAAYRDQLRAHLAGASELERIESFDAPGGFVGSDWWVEAEGTGILVQPRDGSLQFSGRLAPDAEPAVRVATLVPLARLRSVSLPLPLAQLGPAMLGLELTTADRRHGLAVVADAAGRLRWRALQGQRWQPWIELSGSLGGAATLVLDLAGDRVLAGAAEGSQHPLLPRSGFDAEEGRLALLAVGAAGDVWRFGVEEIRWRLRLPR